MKANPFEDKEKKRGVGQPKKIPSGETLYTWFEQYKKSNDNNPVTKMDFKGKDADMVIYEIDRPLSWLNFKVWLYKNQGVGMSTVDDYKANKDNVYDAYSGIIRVIDAEIFGNQYDGAAAGVYQQNIVARRLGLADKSDVKADLTIKETRIGFKNK